MISGRLAEIVAALPLRPGIRVLEIGCGPALAALTAQPWQKVARQDRSSQLLALDAYENKYS